jgi:predicted short-subunit dehydrogenase-like oxidoreductase (DUF2520 family)
MTMIGPLTLGVVGAGRAAKALVPRWLEAGHRVAWQYRRADGLGIAALPLVDVVVVAVSDDALPSMASWLATRPSARDEIWLHLSGSIAGAILRADADVPRAAGCLHPLVALAGREDLQPLSAFAGLDGDSEAVAAAQVLAKAAGLWPRPVDPAHKALYHAAAVTVAGHVTALFAQAVTLMRHAGLDADEARRALQPLLRSAADNLSTMAPAAAITGPAARGDASTITRHLQAMADADVDPAIMAVYRLLGGQALALSAPTLSAAAREALREALETTATTAGG